MTSAAALFALNAAAAPALTMAWTSAALAQSIALTMTNAVEAEKSMQTVANSATSVVCARMIATLQSS